MQCVSCGRGGLRLLRGGLSSSPLGFKSRSTSTASKNNNNEQEEKLLERETRTEDFYSKNRETHFGFETVSEREKARKVKAVFENVADNYDLMNDCMSVGVHRVWKDIFVHKVRPSKHTRVIDVAGGTGDIAFRILKYKAVSPDFRKSIFPNFDLNSKLPLERKIAENEVEAQYQGFEDKLNDPQNSKETEPCSRSVLVCDINPKMLEVGIKRSQSALTIEERRRIEWMEGDAENLNNIPDNSFDVYTIAYGIRNCVHIEQVVAEAYRVLKPGGRFMCLEFSHVDNPAVKWVYDQYSFQIIPPMGQVLAGDWDSYKYLVESIRKFPCQEDFKAIIEQAGFSFVTYENLTFGISSIHSGFKL